MTMDIDAKITQQEAKKLLELSSAQVSRLVRDKWIKTDGKGKVTPRSVFRGYIESIKRGVAKSDADLKAARLADYTQRTEARGDKFRKAATQEALRTSLEIWPEVANFLDSIPPMTSRDHEERARIKGIVDDFRKRFVGKLKARLGTR
jgi:hypothetical protein